MLQCCWPLLLCSPATVTRHMVMTELVLQQAELWRGGAAGASNTTDKVRVGGEWPETI